MKQSSNSWSSPTENTMTLWIQYYLQLAMYDQDFLSLLFNKNLWRNLNIKQRSGMRPVRRLNSWQQRERSLSSCIKILSITLTMSSRSRNIVSLSYESEYKRKKSDSLMLGGLQRMISFFYFCLQDEKSAKKTEARRQGLVLLRKKLL